MIVTIISIFAFVVVFILLRRADISQVADYKRLCADEDSFCE
jgi:hypothetical protein